MEYVKAIKIQKRMLGTTSESPCNAECDTCGFHKQQTGKDLTCEEFPVEFPELAEKILEKWDKENPPKTRIQLFFEAFPDAPFDPDTKIPNACVEDIWKGLYCQSSDIIDEIGDPINNCIACWNSSVE